MIAVTPTVTRSTATYDVDGSSLEELESSLAEHGPDGYAGFTRWYVSWEPVLDTLPDGRVSVARTKVAVDVTTTMPSWRGALSARPALRAEWQRFVSRLADHESVHERNGMQAAFDAARAIGHLGTFPSADAAREAVHAAARAAVRAANARDIDHDERTGHGASEGAVLNIGVAR